MNAAKLLTVQNLSVQFGAGAGAVTAVRDLSFEVAAGEVLALVGESGCGKSVTALALMGLLPRHATVTGSVAWSGRELLGMTAAARHRYRGKRMALMLQEPSGALNPVMTIGEQLVEILRYHRRSSRKEAWRQAVNLLEEVLLPDPEMRARAYPHQLSGGMQQRVLLAAALASEPELLIADEPTTALDVTVQGQIVDLLARLRRQRKLAMITITHDLSLVPALADRIAVLYAGRKMKRGMDTALAGIIDQ